MDTGWVKHKRTLNTEETNGIQFSWVVENKVRPINLQKDQESCNGKKLDISDECLQGRTSRTGYWDG